MPNNIEESKKVLSVTIDENHMADIIINFLGKKEKLQYEIEKIFHLRLNDIEQFHYLLEEKINKEQYINIQLFTVSFLFDDNTTRIINTIESLNSYHETRDVTPISANLSWNIILQFPNSDTIESQKIDLNFSINPKGNIGEIFLNIEHTNQAWGIEVLNLLKNKILSIIKPEESNLKYARIIKRNINFNVFFNYILIIALTSTIVFFPLSLVTEKNNNKYSKNGISAEYILYKEYKSSKISKDKLNEYMFIISNLDREEQEEALKKYFKKSKLREYLIDSLDKEKTLIGILNKFIGNEILLTADSTEKNRDLESLTEKPRRKILLTIISAILIFIFSYYYLIKYISFHSGKSFILTTNKINYIFEKYNIKKNKREFYSIKLIIFTIISGLLVNYLFQIFF